MIQERLAALREEMKKKKYCNLCCADSRFS